MLPCRHRIPLDNWWLKLRPLLRILAKHESVYEVESIAGAASEVDVGVNLAAWACRSTVVIDRRWANVYLLASSTFLLSCICVRSHSMRSPPSKPFTHCSLVLPVSTSKHCCYWQYSNCIFWLSPHVSTLHFSRSSLEQVFWFDPHPFLSSHVFSSRCLIFLSFLLNSAVDSLMGLRWTLSRHRFWDVFGQKKVRKRGN